VAVSSGTTALQLALMAVGVTAGKEVLVPAYACAALLSAVAASGGTAVLVDCEPGGFNLSVEDALRNRTSRTAAVVVAHLFGVPVPIEPFRCLGTPIVEDCAQCVGAREGGELTGSRGDAAMTSFYATKPLTTGQGGLVTGTDDVLARVDDLVEYDNRDDWKPRLSCRMGDQQAALGLWQLERYVSFLRRRQEIAAYYDERLPESAPVSRATQKSGSIAYRYIIRTRSATDAIETLRSLGVDAKRPVYRPLHHYTGGDLPEAQRCHDSLVSLPIYPTLTSSEVEKVAASAAALASSLHYSLNSTRK
jgi:dTDP-4-amino-4,6-dideoxygalactose transaminase